MSLGELPLSGCAASLIIPGSKMRTGGPVRTLHEYIRTLTKAGGCSETQPSPAYLQRLPFRTFNLHHCLCFFDCTDILSAYLESTLHAPTFSILAILALCCEQ
jgi:hypothetical protein